MSFKRKELVKPYYEEYIPLDFKQVIDNYNYFIWSLSLPQQLAKLRPSWSDKINSIHSELIKPLTQALSKIKTRTNKEIVVIDASSGSGALVPLFSETIKNIEDLSNTQFYLTDLKPNTSQWKPITQDYSNISFIGDSVDPTLPSNFHQNWDKSAFKLFLSHSQFNNFYAKKIIKDCLDSDEGFMIVETYQRETYYILFMLVFLPVLIWLTAPFIVRPLSLTKLFFTYIIPINIMLVVFDHVIHCTRARTLEETKNLTKGLKQGKNWQFVSGSYSGLVPFTYVHYLIGTRKK